MKKLIALFLALVLALGLMACASSANTETTTQPAETTAPATRPTDAAYSHRFQGASHAPVFPSRS